MATVVWTVVGWSVAGGNVSSSSESEPPVPADLVAVDPQIVELVEQQLDAVRSDPSSGDGWARLGKVYQAHGWAAQASAAYERAVALEAERAEWWHLLALARAELHDLAGALAANDEVLRRRPDYGPAHADRGRWLLDLGRLDEAMAAFSAGERLDPSSVEAAIGVARVLLARGEAEAAAAKLEALTAAEPTDGYARRLLGQAYRALGRLEDAELELSRGAAPRAEPADPWREAVDRLRTGLANTLKDSTRWLEDGAALRAIRRLEAQRQRHPGNVLLLNKLAEAYLVGGHPDLAVMALTEALELEEDDWATHLHLSQAHTMRQQLDRALTHAESASALNPRLWVTHYQKAQVLRAMGRIDLAIASLEASMAAGGDQQPQALSALGDLRYQRREWAAAAEVFERLVDRFPHLVLGHAGLAVAWGELGRLAEADDAIGRALRIEPDNQGLRQIEQRLLRLRAAVEESR